MPPSHVAAQLQCSPRARTFSGHEQVKALSLSHLSPTRSISRLVHYADLDGSFYCAKLKFLNSVESVHCFNEVELIP